MHIARLKRWQWGGIGLILGLAFSWWWGWAGGTLLARTTLQPREFEKLLVAKSALSGQPLLKDICYYGWEGRTAWVTAEQLIQEHVGAKKQEVYIPVKVPVPTPFVPSIDPPAHVDPGYTVVDYLKSVKAKHPELSFSTRWWNREPLRSIVFALIGMVLLAGICPLLAPRPSEASDSSPAADDRARERARFRGRKKTARVDKSAELEAAQERSDRLNQLEAELEQRLASTGGASDSPGSTTAAAPPQPGDDQPAIRKLDAGPLQPQAQEKAGPQKDYDGEFYPTEAHGNPKQ